MREAYPHSRTALAAGGETGPLELRRRGQPTKSAPGVCDCEIGESVEVAGVASDHGHVVVNGGGRDECVSVGCGVRYV